MPAWIMVPVGAGNLKPVPGPVALVADAAISPLGVDPRWQDSQVAVVGICEVVPGAAEDGITTMELMPVKLAPVMPAPWQTSQPVVMPLWLKAELVNLAVFCTGSVRLLVAPTWQVSQAVVPNGTCLAGGATRAGLILVVA